MCEFRKVKVTIHIVGMLDLDGVVARILYCNIVGEALAC